MFGTQLTNQEDRPREIEKWLAQILRRRWKGRKEERRRGEGREDRGERGRKRREWSGGEGEGREREGNHTPTVILCPNSASAL